MEQEREEELSKQVVLQVQKYEGEKVKESNVDEIIQKALRKKRDDTNARQIKKNERHRMKINDIPLQFQKQQI